MIIPRPKEIAARPNPYRVERLLVTMRKAGLPTPAADD